MLFSINNSNAGRKAVLTLTDGRQVDGTIYKDRIQTRELPKSCQWFQLRGRNETPDSISPSLIVVDFAGIFVTRNGLKLDDEMPISEIAFS